MSWTPPPDRTTLQKIPLARFPLWYKRSHDVHVKNSSAYIGISVSHNNTNSIYILCYKYYSARQCLPDNTHYIGIINFRNYGLTLVRYFLVQGRETDFDDTMNNHGFMAHRCIGSVAIGGRGEITAICSRLHIYSDCICHDKLIEAFRLGNVRSRSFIVHPDLYLKMLCGIDVANNDYRPT